MWGKREGHNKGGVCKKGGTIRGRCLLGNSGRKRLCVWPEDVRALAYAAKRLARIMRSASRGEPRSYT